MAGEILIAILGSGALSALISGLFGLYQARKSRQAQIEEDLADIKTQLETAEKDALRTQLMVMIKDYPHETSDILRLAEHYFVKLGGNWVLTDIFITWTKETGTEIPAWFSKKRED